MTGQDGDRRDFIVYTPLDTLTTSYEIGDLYDARHRRFLHAGKLFRTEEIRIRDKVSSYEYVEENNVSERMDKLGVSASLKVDLLVKKVNLASVSYTKTDKEYAARHTRHMILKAKTGTRKVDSSVYDLPEKDLALKGSCATHVITKITMGCNVAATISVRKARGFSREQVAGSLKWIAEEIAAGMVSKDLKRASETFRDEVSVKVVGDLELGSTPQSLEGMVEFMRLLPQRVQAFNGGWGLPKEVHLTPLTTFKAFESRPRVSIPDVEAGTVQEISMLMVKLEGLVQDCEELKISNKHKSGCWWSAGVNTNLREFEDEVQSQIVTIQSELEAALNNLYLENDEGDLRQKLEDYQSFTMHAEGAKWLSSVRQYIERLKAIAEHIESQIEAYSSVQLRWTSLSSRRALTTHLLKLSSPTVVLKIIEKLLGARSFSRRDAPDPDCPTPDNKTLQRLTDYVKAHAERTPGAELTILAYDGHGVDNDNSGPTVLQVEDYELIDLGPAL